MIRNFLLVILNSIEFEGIRLISLGLLILSVSLSILASPLLLLGLLFENGVICLYAALKEFAFSPLALTRWFEHAIIPKERI